MSNLIVIKKSDRQISENFKEKEFYSKSVDAPIEHTLDARLITAAQLIRSFMNELYGVKVEITSSYRTPLHTRLLTAFNPNAVKNSPHMKNIAIDFKFVGGDIELANKYFSEQVEIKGLLFNKLRVVGISGFGLYDGFFHLDTRDSNTHPFFNMSDENGKYCVWDKKKRKMANLVTVF